MVTTCDRVLAIYIETLPALEASTRQQGNSIDALAAQGCNGFLVFSDGSADTSEDRLKRVLGMKQGQNSFLYPKMPVSFFSTAASSCSLATSLGFESVEKLPEDEQIPAMNSRIFSLLDAEPFTAKRLVFVHVAIQSSTLPVNHWVQSLLSQVLAIQKKEPKLMVSLIQTASKPLQASNTAGDPSSPFYPKQSFLKVDHQYLPSRDQYTRLLYGTYGLDAVRKDNAQHFTDDDIDQHGSYGSMHVGVFMKEAAFRLGFAPKYGA